VLLFHIQNIFRKLFIYDIEHNRTIFLTLGESVLFVPAGYSCETFSCFVAITLFFMNSFIILAIKMVAFFFIVSYVKPPFGAHAPLALCGSPLRSVSPGGGKYK